MTDVIENIKKDAEKRVLQNNDGNQEFLMYIDNKKFEKGEKLDIISGQIKLDQPTTVVFVDDEPGRNFAHRCHYLLYDANSGKFIKKVPAEFPYFMMKTPKTVELFRTCSLVEGYRRKPKNRVALEPKKMSAYLELAQFPLKFGITGTRYAILMSGGSNGRHVNDMEFLYRTLIDVYGYDAANIYVLNYDGTLNYNQMPWETAPAAGFGPDGSAWRMVVNGPGTRAGFQAVLNTLKAKMKAYDCLLIHTNNHGGSSGSTGYIVTSAGGYMAADFANDIATLPHFKNLLVVMEQCFAGCFSAPVIAKSTATNTVFQAAVPCNQTSAGGWPFDPWAEMWISAMAGVRGDGSPLAISPDLDLNSLISAYEAYQFAIHIDNPVMAESSADLSRNLYLSRCKTTVKPFKEFKEIKEHKEPKEIKEHKEIKEYREPKELFEPKMVKEPKMAMEPKAYEGHEIFEKYEERFQRISEQIDDRMERLEEAVGRVTPFIKKEERPVLKPKTVNKPK